MTRSSIAMTTAAFIVLSAGSALAQDSEDPRPGLFGTSFLEGWKKYVGLGFTGTDGNVNESRLVADAKGEFENDRHRRKLTSQFYISKPDSDSDAKTDRKAFVDYEENWKPFENMVYFIGTARYDYERFQAWNSRIAGSLGVGYELYKTERTALRGSVGGGVAYKFQTDGNADVDNETIPEGVIRVSLDHNVMKGVDFTTTHSYYPNFDDTDELRVISDAELKADIGEAGGLNVAVGVINEYDSIADNNNNDKAAGIDIEDNDLTYYIRFGYDF
ncbi:MAG: DUF481 domain-containing protein [Myxococcota bacterium]|nr:DUF481 domain-containing protein [Myxococcota bacterium]